MTLQSLFIFVVFICSIQDLNSRRVSNFLIIILLAISLLFIVTEVDIELNDWEFHHLWSIALVSVMIFPLFYKGLFGAADVKLLIVIAMISPVNVILDIFLYSFLSFLVYWMLFARGQKEAPFVPSLLAGVVVSLWIL
ncbi:prepilin peptidase [Photobacterium salinisoli]|uniref:prepilin peptidase n=1 Tax=Photobacterium salinisoli TaxID=1616783 RepID=UPI000EA112C8|nr:prepilin peptidase [Photobacterium salinisoli]